MGARACNDIYLWDLKRISPLPRLALTFRAGDKKRKFAVVVILECLCVKKKIVLVFKNHFSFALLCQPFSSVFFREPQMGQVKDGELIFCHVVTKDLLLGKMSCSNKRFATWQNAETLKSLS